jgi:hypothetical protein
MPVCEVEKYFSEYIRDELSGSQIEQFYRHIESCPDCAMKLQRFYQIQQTLTKRERITPAAELLHEYNQEVNKIFRKPNIHFRILPDRLAPLLDKIIYRTSRWIRIAEVTAIVLIGVVVGRFLFNDGQKTEVIEIKSVTYLSKPVSKTDIDYLNYYFQASEMLLLEMSNMNSDDFSKSSDFIINKEIAQKLLIKTFMIHRIAFKLNDLRILGFLSKMELILYELSNVDESTREVTVESILLGIEEQNLIEESRILQRIIQETTSLPG